MLPISPSLTLPILTQLLTESEPEPIVPPWTVQEAPGKGVGAYASRPITRGELITNERPLCVWPQDLSADEIQTYYDDLSPEAQAAFSALMGDSLLEKRATNGFAIGLPATGDIAACVFEALSRINHSCVPNCAQVFNFGSLSMEIYAVTDIPEGTELTIEYLPGLVLCTQSERRAELQKHFNVDTCRCELCAGECTASDARRMQMKKLVNEIAGGEIDRATTLSHLGEIQKLLAEEEFRTPPDFGLPHINSAYMVFTRL